MGYEIYANLCFGETLGERSSSATINFENEIHNLSKYQINLAQ